MKECDEGEDSGKGRRGGSVSDGKLYKDGKPNVMAGKVRYGRRNIETVL